MRSRRAKPEASRRGFLHAAATGGAAMLGFPAVAKAQGQIKMRWQSTWPAKSIFHEFAQDFARKVNDMTGGDLRIEVLPAGAVVTPFGLLEAVSKGALDGGHGVLDHHFSRHTALGLWGSSPAFGMDANLLLAWHKYGGGKALLAKVYAAIGADVTSYLYGPMPTQPLGWFKKPITRAEDFKRLKFRAVGMSIEVFSGLGAQVNALPAADIVSAMERGLLDGAEYNNVTSDRALGLPEVASYCMLQSYHQNSQQFEVLFNKSKHDALPAKIKAILENAIEAASADMGWKAADRYSKDLVELQAGGKVRMAKTPDAVLQRQLASYDAAASRQRQASPLFLEIEQSQREFAARAVRWLLATQVSPRLAYQHYFGKKPAARRKK